MALTALFYLLSLCDLHGILAAPAHYNFPTISMMNMSRGGFGPFHKTSLSTVEAGSLSPLPVIPRVTPHTSQDQYAFSVAILSTAFPFMEEQPMTTVTEIELTTITLSPPATTVTTFITIPVSASTAPPSPIPTPNLEGLGPAKAIWVAPSKMDDLTPFGVASFSGERKNLQIVTEIPAEASAIPTKAASTKSDDSTSIFQFLFPAGSIDPARKPPGGAEFYAVPLDTTSAKNVTLRYRVFFPADFDWVLAGKLPGLFGGHKGCSGGNLALDCFSTRLMWREGGIGELYLYAPKYKQTKALCSDPGSSCDAAYGLSIGRGSFRWAAGDWTTVQQTVVLNTPGMQDGCFMLDVNGQRVIDRVDVLYRDDLSGNRSGKGTPSSPKKTTTSTKRAKPTPTSGSTKDGGLLGPILGGLLHGRGLQNLIRNDKGVVSIPVTTGPAPAMSQSGLHFTISPQPTSNNAQPAPTAATSLDTVLSRSSSNVQVGFIGIFFSTFFGGHEDKYATPRDQYVWFKDFALAYNS